MDREQPGFGVTGGAGAAGAWRGPALDEHTWRVAIPEAVAEELDGIRADRPSPGEDAVALPATAAFARAVRERLLAGPGVLVGSRLPLERWSPSRRYAAVGALAGLIAPIVSQDLDGRRIYDVHDTGRSLEHGVRRSLTNLAQPFHTDGPWLPHTPHIVGLYCLAPSPSGGTSRCLSLRGVHADLERDAPELCRRLFEPFAWDRQAEHGPHEPRFSRHPVFWRGGAGVSARIYTDYIHKGALLAGESLDALAAAALEALDDRFAERERWLELRLDAGEVLWLDNRRCAHSRTAFSDAGNSQPQRLLVRTWGRFEGGPSLEGQADSATGSARGSHGGSVYRPCT